MSEAPEYEFGGDEFLGDSAPSGNFSPSAVGDDTAPTDSSGVDKDVASPQADTETAAQPSTLSPDITALIARERLPAIPGETEAAALRRLYDHQRQRADRLYYDEVRGAKTAAQAAREELASFKSAMEPLIVAFRERQAEAERELRESQIPEQGTPEYLAWQQQQILSKLDQREQREAEERAMADELAQQESLISFDETADAYLEQAITNDPETRAAYEFNVQLGLRAAQRAYPTATQEQHIELVRLSQILDIRNAINNGIMPGDLFKQRMADVIAMTEGVRPNNGNGKPPTQPETTKQGSSTAKQLTAAKAKAQARAVVTPSQVAATPPSGDGVDFSQMDEDALLEFVLADSANATEYSRWVEQKHGKATWR